ncbi:EAL domain-containing protein [Noviherbaspirillum sp. UKPF54]|uniref:bifunctional diguanylate cyclase/phosphodiesterase n=1 Tax=Noviherbaspirillum sp. UKPF54 TaxID=2601898 RepID=UPI0011B0FB8B|nr:EAL domain-containing protein [Noviherbaspirillum sp. UKPF54]QDZ28375.1 EAL domain-containing protein [Noviherbaspirillum sp. UKPF54]
MSISASGKIWGDPLGRRLLAAILFCSTGLALIATGSQLLLDYRQGVSAVESRMAEIEHAYLDSVAASLWTMDEQQTRKQIEGIARLPDIESVELRDPIGMFLMRAGAARSAENMIHREIPIRFADDSTPHIRVPLGTLMVSASLDNLYRDLRNKALLILVAQTTKTAIVAFFTLFIFRRMVSRHLSAIAAYARRLDLDKLGEPLALRRRKRKADELDVVVDAFNDMAGSIRRDVEELARYRSGLEQLVAVRTGELAQKIAEKDEVIRRLNREMTERQAAERTACESEERWRQVVEMSPDAIMIERNGRIVFVNRGALELLGAPNAAQIRAMSFMQLIPADWRERLREKMEAAADREEAVGCFEGRMARFDGKVIDVEIRRAVFRYEGSPAVQTVVRDITRRKDYEEQLRRQAMHDALTGLPNRVLLMDRLDQAIAQARRRRHAVFVLFFDLDRFKYVNDMLGHDAGDELLCAITGRMAECARNCDTLARLGGDEFVMVIDGVEDEQGVPALARRLMERICAPILLRDQEIAVTCSIGISAYPHDADDPHTLLKYADTAMYHAKEKGRNTFERYTAEMHSRVNEHLLIESNLRRALERNEFLLHYQPLVDLGSGRIVGAEALVRWRHPELGMVAPARFIPLAEETGLITGIGEWVMRSACRQARAWHDAGFGDLQVAVNLSTQQLTRAGFDAEVAAALADAGLEPRYLELEITESASMKHPERTVVLLARLKQMGMSIAIDDFGTGYSNLSYLKRFPVDRLKLDRAFVSDITSKPEDSELARAIIAMARSLRLTVVAEGVEDAQQVELLRAYGCDQVQGYYFSPPLAPEDFADVLRSGRTLGAVAAA